MDSKSKSTRRVSTIVHRQTQLIKQSKHSVASPRWAHRVKLALRRTAVNSSHSGTTLQHGGRLSSGAPPPAAARGAHLRNPSSFTAAEGAPAPDSENTSTNRLPALGGAALTGAAERRPRRSADGEGVDWNRAEGEDV